MAFTGTVTFNPVQAKDTVHNPAFYTPEITESLTIVDGIKSDLQVIYLGIKDKITKADPGCGDTSTDSSIIASEKTWTPKRVEMYERICATDWNATLYAWSMKGGLDFNDLTDSDIAMYIMETYPDVLRSDALRMAWFGDTAAATAATTGTIKSALDIPFYNPIDGLWKKIFAAVTALTTRRVTITENALTTFALQLALPADAAYNYFMAMTTGATDQRLKRAKDKVLLCTDTLFENFLATKNSKVLESSFARQDEYYTQGMINGVKIIPQSWWDRYIQADFLPTGSVIKYFLPHRALLTTVSNLQLGLDTNNVEALDMWYDKDTKYTKVRAGYKLDTQIAYDFMNVAAY